MTVAVKVVPLAAIACVESNVEAMLTLPHGDAVDGRWTLLRLGVPLTPRAGLMIAWAETSRERLTARRAVATRDLEKKNIVPDFGWVCEDEKNGGGSLETNGDKERTGT